MEDFYMNITSQNNSYDYNYITSNYSNITSNYSNITSNYSNITDDYYDYYYYDYYDLYYSSPWFIMDVVTCVIIGVGLFTTLMGINILYSQVRNDNFAPIYVINLLISDIIQFCCLIIEVTPNAHWKIYVIFRYIYYSALMVSVGFMMCIALERYLIVTCPLWYRFRRTSKISVGVCVLVWALALGFELIYYFTHYYFIIFSVFSLLPLPLFIFFLVRVLKALSASVSVPSDEKRRIVAVLVVVLLIYTLLFMPNVIYYFTWITRYEYNFTFRYVSVMFLKLSPLADLILYVLMRKGTIDKLLSSVCCCRMDSDDTNSSSV